MNPQIAAYLSHRDRTPRSVSGPRSDIAAGQGVCLIDPHGDLAEEVVAGIPSHRTNDVVYFDPADSSFPIGLNPLDCSASASRHLTAVAITGVVQKVGIISGVGKMMIQIGDKIVL